jgi:hypothetical protein
MTDTPIWQEGATMTTPTAPAAPITGGSSKRSRELPAPKKKSAHMKIRIGAVVAIAAAAGLGVWLYVGHGGSSAGSAKSSTGAVAVSQQGIKTIANALGHPIYWAGRQPGMTYELTQASNGRVFVRYLPSGIAVGSKAPELTIATYPVVNAFGATSAMARRSDAVKVQTHSGAIAFFGKSRPTNVYEAFPGSNYQIEIYSPSAVQAQGMVRSGLIGSLGAASASATAPPAASATAPPATNTNGAVAASQAELKAAAVKLGHPIYWAGSKSATTYELTETADGRIFVRYLPVGVAVGTSKVYPTVGTYPVKGAYATTSSAAGQPGTVRIPVDGGVAFYSKARPNSVYVAYKGSDEQIEVYAPSAAQAHQLVASGGVSPVS